MAAATARILMNPLQFKDKYPYHTPIFTVNLRRSHPCNGKRPLTMKDGSIEGVPRLRAAYQGGVPGADSESAAEKADPNCEACFDEAVEDRLVDRAVPKIDWSCYNLLCRLLRSCDVGDQKLDRLLDHLQKPLPDGEVDFWMSGLDDPFLADVVTAKRKYNSALFAYLSVDAAKWKLGAKVAEKDPLWADLVAESETVENLLREFNNLKFNYALKRLEKGMTREDFEEKLDSTISALHGCGQIYSPVVAKWLIKYGIRLFEIEVDDATKTEEL